MKTATIPLWPDAGTSATLTRHVRGDDVSRPAVLVIPGGGYARVCGAHSGSVPVAPLSFLRGQGYRCVGLGAALREQSRCRAK